MSAAIVSKDIAGWVLQAVFVVAASLLAWRAFSGNSAPVWWPETLLLLSATAITLLSLSRRLPAQNVALAAAVVAVFGAGIHILAIYTAIPFGPIVFTDAGPLVFNVVPWSVPFLWIVILLSSRGVARLILRPWRKSRMYGFRVIGLTAVLTALFDLGLELFATRVNHYWLWSPTRFFIDWYGTPVTSFTGWLLATVLVMAFAMPALMKKRQQKVPPHYGTLVVWAGLELLFIAGAASRQLWLGAGVCAAVTVAVVILAVRGARW